MEFLKELMGDAYKEGLTKEEVQAFFKKQVLASGEYARKEHTDATEKQLNATIAELQQQLAGKMTDDEKKKQADAETKKLIEDLQKQLADSKSSLSKRTAISSLAEAKLKAGIKDDDKEYDDFISSISFEDNDKTDKVSKYISQIVSKAYDAGKSEAVKNKLGKMGSFKEGNQSDGGDEKGSYGKELAKSTNLDTAGKKNFFERK